MMVASSIDMVADGVDAPLLRRLCGVFRCAIGCVRCLERQQLQRFHQGTTTEGQAGGSVGKADATAASRTMRQRGLCAQSSPARSAA